MKHKNEWNRLLGMICCLTLVLFMVPTLRPWAVDRSAGGGLHGDETETGEGSAENAQERTEQDEGAEETKAGGQNFVSGETEAGEETDHVPGEDAATKDGTELELEDGECADSGGIEAGIEDGIETGTVAEAQKVMAVSAGSDTAGDSYTDSRGNVFSLCIVDGDITITGIMVSGQELVIPDTIDDAPVVAVGNDEYACVVANPETEIDSLYINCERIGAFAFSGIKVGELTIGEDVRYLEESLADTSSSLHCWEQFHLATVGKLNLRATNLVLEHTRPRQTLSSILGPFYRAVIGELEIGEDVEAVPEAFLYDATLRQSKLELHVPQIGALAFADGSIRFDELVIGSEVSLFHEGEFSNEDQHLWKQFAGVEIGTLRYQVPDLTLEHRNSAGMVNIVGAPFKGAKITSLEIGTDVEVIPEYFLYQAEVSLDQMELQVPEIGAYAFSGEKIRFGELVIGSGVERFTEGFASAGNRHEWNQFADTTIGTLKFLVPELEMEHMAGSGLSISVLPPFARAVIGSLEIGPDVEKIPECFLYNAKMSLAGLEIHVPEIGAYAFAGENISIDTLTIGKEVSVFSEYCFSDSSSHYWGTFAQCRIGHLVYSAEEAVVDNTAVPYGSTYTNIYAPPFMQAQIGELTITEDVKCIPDYFLYKAKADLDEVCLDMPVIGAMAFMGADMKIRSLTIGEHVTTFSRVKYDSSSSYLWEQFEGATVGDVYFNAISAVLDRAMPDRSYYRGPFYQTKVDTLHFGSAVEVIPAYCFNEVILEQDELEIHAKSIGEYAFCSEKVLIEDLTVGKEVETLSCQKSGSMMYFKQFAGNKIGTLYYEPAAAETGTSCYGGVFNKAEIGEVVFGDEVEVIPNYLFYNAIIDFGNCFLDIPTIGYYSFYGNQIKFSKLILGEHVTSFPVNSSNYNRAFYYNQIDCLCIRTSSIRLLSVHGPFSASVKINTLEIGEDVVYLDSRLFYNVSVSDCYVYPVDASDEYAAQTLSYFPVSENLYIHYNSDFRPLFEKKAANEDWLCKNYYELSYGETVYDEVLDEYLMEVIRHCPICGHEEVSTEELDDSYSLFISLPVEISLSFSADSKSYEGWGQVLVYGEIGNAYSAAKVVVDKEREEYGTARNGESVIDISPFLSTSFCEGEEAVFPAFNIVMNTDSVEKANVEGFYTDDLTVTVLGYAFLMSGPGEYRIPIPLKVVVY